MGRHCVFLVLASVVLTQVLGQTRTVPKPAGCGTSLGCYSDCQQATCRFVVSWSTSGTSATYTLTANVDDPTGSWIAVAFSTDQTMKDDNVLGCARNAAGQSALFNARTGDHALPSTAMYNDAEVTMTSSALANGILTCTIQRPVSGSTAGRVDVTSPWTLFFATGAATISATNQVSIARHTSANRHYSPVPVKVSELIDIGSNGTATPVAGTIAKPAGCGRDVGCVSDCVGTSCSFIVSWKENGTIGEYTLAANVAIGGPGVWIAVGFSTDNAMKDDDVMGCATNGSGTPVPFNVRTAFHSLSTMYDDADVKLISSSLQNSVLTCVFQRPVNGSATTGRVDVASPWVLLLATGNASIDAANKVTIRYHFARRFISAESVKISDLKDLKADGTPSEPPAEPALAGTVPKPVGCGSTFGCFSNCKGTTCGFVVSWRVVGDTAEYTLVANVAPSAVAWIAVAFSSDSVMKDDDVLGCATNGSGRFVPFRAQTGDHNIAAVYSNDNVTVISSNLANNVMTCIIQRPISGNASFGRFDVASPWTLLFATASGSLVGNQVGLGYHDNNKYISNQKISINDKVDAVTGALVYPLVKAHGSLMIAAWIFLASIGIVLARYFKPAWKGLICSEKVWFQMHRICMILVFLTTSIGFIIIFIEVNGYSQIQDSSRTYLVGHPIIGIIVMILTVLNPIMALFRCHPGTSKRPIFNWSHRIVGTSAHFLGVLNIFFGVLLSKSNVPYYLVYILGAYVAWQIFVELLLEVITCFGLKKDSSEAYELSSGDNQKHTSTEESRGTIVIKRIILVAHCFIVAAFAAVLIGLLAAGNENL